MCSFCLISHFYVFFLAFVPGFKKDVSIRTTLPPGDLPTNTWSPINQQFAYRLSGQSRPGTVIKFHPPVVASSKKINANKSSSDKKEPPRFNQTQQQRQVHREYLFFVFLFLMSHLMSHLNVILSMMILSYLL